MDSEGNDVQIVGEGDSREGSSSSGSSEESHSGSKAGMNCHFHAGVEYVFPLLGTSALLILTYPGTALVQENPKVEVAKNPVVSEAATTTSPCASGPCSSCSSPAPSAC